MRNLTVLTSYPPHWTGLTVHAVRLAEELAARGQRALPLNCAELPRVHPAYAGDHQVAYGNFYGQCRPLLEVQRDHLTMVALLRDPQELACFYSLCDLVVVPSRTDNLSLVEIEALFLGTPLMVS